MAAYGLFDVRAVTDPGKMERYQSGVLATVKRHGGQYLVVGGRCEAVEGDWSPAFPVLIKFPSLEHAHRWYNSDEYKNLKSLRLSATKGSAVFMESEPSEFVAGQ